MSHLTHNPLHTLVSIIYTLYKHLKNNGKESLAGFKQRQAHFPMSLVVESFVIKVHEPRGVQVQVCSTFLPINTLNSRSTHQSPGGC